MLQFLATLVFTGLAAALYASNINYRSPSHKHVSSEPIFSLLALNTDSEYVSHPGLGVSIYKVNKRNNGSSPYSPTALNFTHGVASGDPFPNSVIIWT